MLLAFTAARAQEPVVTVLADFEDESVAATIGDVQNILAADCATSTRAIPARGQRSLALEIGATVPHASVACDLLFRLPTRFTQGDRVAAYCQIKQGRATLAFRIRDALGQVFETPAQTVQAHFRWILVSSDLSASALRRIRGDRKLTWPIQIQGYRVTTPRIGRQEVFLDDLHVEHRVRPDDVILGDFLFERKPTKIYEPGATVDAKVHLENRSRRHGYRVEVELAWLRPDGSTLMRQPGSANLPASGRDFRSRQAIDFSHRIEEPGLYRLVARARARRRNQVGGRAATIAFETTIAVAPSNRQVPRGRATFFGVGTNLLREPVQDQLLEIELAREIGVNLLAIETPWKAIEPKEGDYKLADLNRVVDKVTSLGMAPMIVLSDPPTWATGDSASFSRRRRIMLDRLARHYGQKVSLYRLSANLLNGSAAGSQGDVLRELQRTLSQAAANTRVVSAPLEISHGSKFIPPSPADRSGLDWSYATSGGVAASLAARAAVASSDFDWSPSSWWLHAAAPTVGPGSVNDAEAVLRAYVRAAESGVAGLVWFDLRDDDNDPRNVDALRGLVRRDFSPRTPLTGYATAAGTLTGLRYAGPVLNTPDSFESALFIGSERQVAVFLPRPNRIRPALLAPFHVVPGELVVHDFERRPQRMLRSAGPDLARTLARPLFVTLKLDNPQPNAQIGLAARPWLRLPARVFCGADAGFTIEIQAPLRVRQGFLRITLPSDAPFESDVSARGIRAQAGEVLSFPVQLTRKAGAAGDFEQSELIVRVSLGGRAINVPIKVCSPALIRSIADGGTLASEAYRVGELAVAGEGRTSASGKVFAGRAGQDLKIAVTIEDDRFVARGRGAGTRAGDELLLGLAVESATQHGEARIDDSGSDVRLERVFGMLGPEIERWSCTATRAGGERTYELTIPAASLGLEGFDASRRVLLAVRYLDDDAAGLGQTALSWGRGLDGTRSSEGYRWLRFSP